MEICMNELWICSECECWKLILILKLKSLCEKWGCCFEVRTLVPTPEILAPRWKIKEDRCQCVVSLCHGLVPHNSSLIVITCINMMRLTGIDSQMILKAKTWILLYKDFVVSHKRRLRKNNEFKLRLLIYDDFMVFLVLFH